MKTSSFLLHLRQHSSLPLVFQTQDETIPAGFHLTEVKRVSYETMDCGAMAHTWAETQFELWVPPHAEPSPERGPMSADKFLRIVDRVAAKLPLPAEAPVRILANFPGQPAALNDITAVTVTGGELVVELTPDRTRCKAAKRQSPASSGGCCGTSPNHAETAPTAKAGCCGSGETNVREEACCH